MKLKSGEIVVMECDPKLCFVLRGNTYRNQNQYCCNHAKTAGEQVAFLVVQVHLDEGFFEIRTMPVT